MEADDNLAWMREPRYGPDELTVKGDVLLGDPEVVQRK
jgi:hypothetical protein